MISARSFCLLATVLAVSCFGGLPDSRTLEFRGPTMGTTYSVKIVGPEGGLSAATQTAAENVVREELRRVDSLMSTWDPQSELSRFNASRTLRPLLLSPANLNVLERAIEFSSITGGAFDVTVGPLVEAWGFGASGPRDASPDDEEIAHLRSATGMQLLELDPVLGTVRKLHPEVGCDFSGLAAGYVCDRVAARFRELGLTDFLIDMGGELKAAGRSESGQPWRVAIDRPQSKGRSIERVLALSDTGISTSGDYRKYREVNGVRESHVLDPRTGRPVHHKLASVTVVDAETIRADALSTAFMVLGVGEGLVLAEKLEVAALFLVREEDGSFSEHSTAPFRALAVVKER